MEVMTLEDIRIVVPDEFLKRVQKLWTSQKRELKKLLGDPPDIKRVKPEHWKQWKKNQDSVLLILMAGYASQYLQAQLDLWDSRIPDQIDPPAVEREFLRQVRRRARFASQSISHTTRRRLSGLLRRARTGDPGAEDSGAEDRRVFDLETLFSDSRAEMVARTEMTAANTSAIRSIYDAMVDSGIQCQLVWKLRPCNHCEVCPALDGTPHSFWSRFTDGPPIHPHCCCELVILLGTRAALIRSGQMNRNPSVQGIRSAIQRSGFRL